MPSIIEFLEARITEDEAIARASAVPEWSIDHSQEPAWVTGLYIHAMDSTWDACIDVADAEHAVRHDPARVLAECEAKRAIIEAHPITDDVLEVSTHDKFGFACETCFSFGDVVEDHGYCDTLRALAAVYSDHPDYQQEWAA